MNDCHIHIRYEQQTRSETNTLCDSKCLIYSNVKLQSDLLILQIYEIYAADFKHL